MARKRPKIKTVDSEKSFGERVLGVAKEIVRPGKRGALTTALTGSVGTMTPKQLDELLERKTKGVKGSKQKRPIKLHPVLRTGKETIKELRRKKIEKRKFEKKKKIKK